LFCSFSVFTHILVIIYKEKQIIDLLRCEHVMKITPRFMYFLFPRPFILISLCCKVTMKFSIILIFRCSWKLWIHELKLNMLYDEDFNFSLHLLCQQWDVFHFLECSLHLKFQKVILFSKQDFDLSNTYFSSSENASNLV